MSVNLVEITPADEFALAYLPTPLAINYQRILEASNWEILTRRLLETFEKTLRAITLTLISDYIRNDEKSISNLKLNRILLTHLPRAQSLGTWEEIFVAAMEAYQGREDYMFMPGLHNLYWELDKKSLKRRGEIKDIFDYLIVTRNNVAHLKVGNWEECGRKCLDKLRRLVNQFQFFRDYDLIRVIGGENGKYLYHLYTGLKISETPEILKVPNLTEGWFYLLHNKKGKKSDVLNLHPLLIFWSEELAISSNNKSDVALYEKYSREIVSYITAVVGEEYKSTKALPHLLALLYELERLDKVRRIQKISWGDLREVSKDITQEFLSKVQREFHEQLYLERNYLVQTLADFLVSDKTCLVITGRSGAGKSTFLASLVDKYKDKINFCVLIINSASQDLYHLGEYKFGDIADNPLIKYIKIKVNQELRLGEGEQIGINDILTEIKNTSVAGNPVLILAFDAINENPQVETLTLWLNQLISANLGPWFKVIITSRPSTWERLQNEIELSWKDYYQAKLPSIVSPLVKKKEIVGVDLSPFTLDELVVAFEKYTKTFNIKSSYKEIHPRIKQLLTDPFTLRLVAESYVNKSIPSDLKLSNVLDNYIEKLDHAEQMFIRDLILPNMIGDNFSKGVEISEWRNQIIVDAKDRDFTAHEKVLYSLLFERTKNGISDERTIALESLLDQEILVAQKTSTIYFSLGFKSDRFFDYFAGQRISYLVNQSDDPFGNCKKIVDQAFNNMHLWGAVRQMLLLELGKGNKRLLEAIASSSLPEKKELCIDVLSTYGEEHSDFVEKLLLSFLSISPQKRGDSFSFENTGIIAVEVAYRLKLKSILVKAANNKIDSVRNSAARHIYYWWKSNPSDGYGMLHLLSLNERGVFGLSAYVSRNVNICITLSMAILFSDPSPEGIAALRRIWQNILESVYFIPKSKGVLRTIGIWLRKPLLAFVLSGIITILRIAEGSGIGTYNFKELASFFSTKYDKKRFNELIPYLDAENTDIGNIQENLIEMVSDRQYLVWILVMMLLEAHFFKYPNQTLPILDKIFLKAVDLCENNGEMPGPYFIVSILTLNEAIAVLGDKVPLGSLERLRYYIHTFQTKHNCCSYGVEQENGKSKMAARFSQLGRYMDQYYKQYGKIDEELAILFLDQAQERNDIKGVEHYINIMGYTGGGEYTKTVSARIKSLELLLCKVNSVTVSENVQKWWADRKEYIDGLLVDVFATLHSHFPMEVEEYLYSNIDCSLPEKLREKVLSREGKEKLGDLLESGASQWVVRNINSGKNRYLITQIQWLLSKAAIAPNLTHMLNLMVKMFVNIIYDDYIFQTDQPLKPESIYKH